MNNTVCMHVLSINKAPISWLSLLEWNQSNGKDRYSSYKIIFLFPFSQFPIFLQFLFDHASTGAKTSPGEKAGNPSPDIF